MADIDKNILITPNKSQPTVFPKIEFTGFDNNPITLSVLDDGTLSFSGSSGQLFSVSDSLAGTIFSVNDISGIPSIEVEDDGTVRLAEFAGNVGIGIVAPTEKLDVVGNIAVSGTVDGRDVAADGTAQDNHIASTANPHSVTKAQVGLGSVDNTSDTAKPVSTAQQTALGLKLNLTGGALTGATTITVAGTSELMKIKNTGGDEAYYVVQSPTGSATALRVGIDVTGTKTSKTIIETEATWDPTYITERDIYYRWDVDGTNKYDNRIYHEGNFKSGTDYAPAHTHPYLSDAGGTLTGTLTGTRVIATGTGNDYNTGGFEAKGNGATNTVFPTYGFHQPGVYASSLQLRAGGDFRFYAQGATGYARVTASNLALESVTPEITFNGTSDGTIDMAIKATPEGLDFYEPEDGSKIHFQILDDLGVNSPFGYQWNGESLDTRYAASSHTHSYLPSVGGSLTGSVSYNDVSRYWLNTATNWGIYWDTTNNSIEFHAAGVDKFNFDLDTGIATATTWVGSLSGNASTATWADTVDVNSSNNDGENEYSLVWHSGDTVYSSSHFTIHRNQKRLTTPVLQTAKVVGTESTGATEKFEISWNDSAESIDFIFR